MARVRGSFLVRCWQVSGGAQRIEVEHIQSGTRTVYPTVAAAIEWICACADGAAGEGTALLGGRGAPLDAASEEGGPLADEKEE